VILATTLAACGGGGGSATSPALPASVQRSVAFEQRLSGPSQGAATIGASITAAVAPVRPDGTTPLATPVGLAMSSSNLLYVADTAENKVVVYSDAGQQVPKMSISIKAPAGLAFDSSGNLYVSRFDSGDNTIKDVWVYNSQGVRQPQLTLKTDPNFAPSGISFDAAGRIWVAERTDNDIQIGQIQIFQNQAVVDTITSGLVYPLGIAFAGNGGNAYVGNAETPNDTVTIYSQSGQEITPSLATPDCAPGYVAFSASGDLYAPCTVGSNQLEVFSPAGKRIKTITDGLDYPIGLAFDRAGDFFVSNAANSTITKYAAGGKLILTIQ
jgi:sugar lactone lactonase YvrE